jgi:hypothetical protein
MEAAADKLRLSARPDIGIVTSVTETPSDAASTPLASFPNIATQSPGIERSRMDVEAWDESKNF